MQIVSDKAPVKLLGLDMQDWLSNLDSPREYECVCVAVALFVMFSMCVLSFASISPLQLLPLGCGLRGWTDNSPVKTTQSAHE